MNTKSIYESFFQIDSNMEAVLQQKVIEVANHVEQQLDAELEKLDNLDINDYEKIRAHRLNELKRIQKQKQDWLILVMCLNMFICFRIFNTRILNYCRNMYIYILYIYLC